MAKKVLVTIAVAIVAFASAGFFLYKSNVAPTVAPLTSARLEESKPVVVKLHAQWCPVCMVTKNVWSQIETTFGDRVHLVVLDFTDEAATAASEAEAKRLGLEAFYAEFAGVTGMIAILDGQTRNVRAAIQGERAFEPYRVAIEAAIGDLHAPIAAMRSSGPQSAVAPLTRLD